MPTPGFYLLSGPDRAGKLQRIQALERQFLVKPLDRHQLDAVAVTLPKLLLLCRQLPAESPRRLVVIDSADRLESASVEALFNQAEVIGQTTTVVFLVESQLSARHPLGRRQEGLIVEYFEARQSPAAKPFALTDALGSRDVSAALSAVHEQRLAGKEPFELLGFLVWQLQRWIVVKRLLDARYLPQQIAAMTDLKPWQIQRIQSEVRNRSLDSLEETLYSCWRADTDMRQGRNVPDIALEEAVIRICVSNEEKD